MSALKEALIIHPDVEIVPFEQLDESLRDTLAGEPGDMAVSRGGTRSVSRIVDAEMAALLLHFRTATRVPNAIVQFATALGEEPAQVLKDALPILGDLHAAGVLATELELDEPEHMHLGRGDSFLGFKIDGPLQAFVDSAVFRVRHEGGLAILKVAPSDVTNSMDPGFENEHARLAELSNASFVPGVLGHGAADGYAWLLIEWRAGVAVNTAAERMRADGELPELALLARGVVQAYADLHARGVVHGDVHPNNMLVNAANEVTLIDFGVGRRIDDDRRHARAGVAFFTEPEVARASLANERTPPVTPHSEQYTVAAVLYELLTGTSHRPQLFNEHDLMQDRATEAPRTFDDVGVDLPAPFEDALMRALASDPSDRFANMAEFAAALPGLVRNDATTTDDLDAFAARVFDSLDPDAALHETGIDGGPSASVAMGAAGIATAFVRRALRTGSPSLLMDAEAGLVAARREADNELAWIDNDGELDIDTLSPASVLHREAGLDFVGCLVASALGRPEQFNANLTALLARAQTAHGASDGDLTIGTLSLVPALAQLRSIVRDESHRCSIDAAATLVLEENPLDPTQITAQSNLGFAHGAVGRAYAHLRWQQVTGQVSADWAAYLDRALQFAYPQGRGANIPWNISPDQPATAMPGWCNGAAGVLTALSLAAKVSGDSEWLARGAPFAWCAYESRESGHDICCGTGGRAYALAEYGAATGDDMWIERARNMVARSLPRVGQADRMHNPEHALIKGDLGVAMLIEDLADPATLSFPVFGALH